jgi:hypothetical protein
VVSPGIKRIVKKLDRLVRSTQSLAWAEFH